MTDWQDPAMTAWEMEEQQMLEDQMLEDQMLEAQMLEEQMLEDQMLADLMLEEMERLEEETRIMEEEIEYKLAGKEKYPSLLHEAEYNALKIVVEMAHGNLHCRQTDERKNALKLVENMLQLRK